MTARGRLVALAITAIAAIAAPAAAAADYGSRTMREGTSGSDVTQLQRYLNRAGFSTSRCSAIRSDDR